MFGLLGLTRLFKKKKLTIAPPIVVASKIKKKQVDAVKDVAKKKLKIKRKIVQKRYGG
jgi:hypothetical protein